MEWRPIEEYDRLKNKPKSVVFLVAASSNGRYALPQTTALERRYGFRTVTHYLVVPDFPEDSK
jgi:hypothetical protein